MPGGPCAAPWQTPWVAGVKVAVLDIDGEKAEARPGPLSRQAEQRRPFHADVLDAAALRDCRRAVCGLWGTPDFLINGAGGNHPRGSTSEEFYATDGAADTVERSFFDLETGDFRRVFDLNFMGAFLTSQTFAREMIAKGKGAIVNISSMSAFTPLTKVVAYSPPRRRSAILRNGWRSTLPTPVCASTRWRPAFL